MSDIRDLQKRALAIRKKYEAYETKKYGVPWTKQELAKGFAKDVSDLVRIIESSDSESAKLEHELADCMWSILVLAHKYGIDIENAFLKTMDELDTRLDKDLDES